jgi:hypothetical protein
VRFFDNVEFESISRGPNEIPTLRTPRFRNQAIVRGGLRVKEVLAVMNENEW